MSRLFMLLLSIAIATMAGIGVIIALVTGHDSYTGVIVGALAGTVAAFPVTWAIAKRIQDNDPLGDDV